MSPWDALLKIDSRGVRLLLTDSLGHDLLKARLPFRSDHPRALLTLLEGAALYSGSVLSVATCVADGADPSPVSGLLGDRFLPIDSALVRFAFAQTRSRQSRLRGLGVFRDVRAIRSGA